jgi:uncharacterized protein
MSMRRFIAGAICPKCRAIDRIVVELDEGGRRRRCVACGYSDTMAGGASAEPATRVTRQRVTEPAALPVRIVDPTPDKS